ncbi:hypothetical protein EMCRGX_G010976 [Ephydatia muelleri]
MTWAGQIWATIELIPARLHLFQKTSLLEDMLNRGIIERVDDIVVFSRTVAEHLSQLRDVRTRLKIASLNLTQSKCHLLKKTGHVAYGKGIETDPEKGRSVCDLQIPLNQKDLKRFLGLASYCRHFVQGFAQKRLVSAPLLVMPHFTQEFILDTYANGEGLGAVLSQVIEGQERVVANANHSSNQWLHSFKKPEGHIARWLEQLAEYNYTDQEENTQMLIVSLACHANLMTLWLQRDQLMPKEGVCINSGTMYLEVDYTGDSSFCCQHHWYLECCQDYTTLQLEAMHLGSRERWKRFQCISIGQARKKSGVLVVRSVVPENIHIHPGTTAVGVLCFETFRKNSYGHFGTTTSD